VDVALEEGVSCPHMTPSSCRLIGPIHYGIIHAMESTIATTIDGAGRLVVPKSIREKAGFKAGTPLEVVLVGDHVEIRPLPRAVRLKTKGGVVVAEPADSSEPLREEVVSRVRDTMRSRPE
jgi:AbrB family looped-hinge helix DNA binding protein